MKTYNVKLRYAGRNHTGTQHDLIQAHSQQEAIQKATEGLNAIAYVERIQEVEE
jgi:hypothetical protein